MTVVKKPQKKIRRSKVFSFQADPDVQAALLQISGAHGEKSRRINEAIRRHLGAATRAVLEREIAERKALLESLGESSR